MAVEIKIKLAIVIAASLVVAALTLRHFVPGGIEERKLDKPPALTNTTELKPDPLHGTTNSTTTDPPHPKRGGLFFAWMFCNDLSVYAGFIIMTIESIVALADALKGVDVATKNFYLKTTYIFTGTGTLLLSLGYFFLMLDSFRREKWTPAIATIIGSVVFILVLLRMLFTFFRIVFDV